MAGTDWLSWLKPIAGPLINSATNLIGAKIQTNANANAAQLEADAAKYSADQQAKAAAATLAYEQQQAAQTQQNFNTTQEANYGQWAARQGNLGALNSALGMAPRNVPAYVQPVTVPPSGSLGGATTPPSGSTSSTPAASTPVDGSPASIAAYYQSRGTTPAPTSVAYWASKWPELVARGQEIGDPTYAMKRLSQADEFGGGGETAPTTTTPKTAPVGSLASAYLPFQAQPNLTLGY